MERRYPGGKHEFSLGNRTIAAFGVGASLVLVVVFLIGVMVGKGLSKIQPIQRPIAEYEIAPDDALVVNANTLGETQPETPASINEEAFVEEDVDVGAAETIERNGVTYIFEGEDGSQAVRRAEAEAATAEPVQLTPTAGITPPARALPQREAEGTVREDSERPQVPEPRLAVSDRTIYYTVQVASFPTPAEAAGYAEQLSSRGLAAYTTQAVVSGAVWYRVRVGRFADRAGARSMADAIQQREGVNPFIDIIRK